MKLGWEIKTLGEVCEVLDSKRIPITKGNRKKGIYPYYGATGVLDYVEDYIFDERLVLLGEDGAKWGAGDKSAFIIYGKTWVNNHAHVLKPNQTLFDKWLVYYLNYSDLSGYITGITVPKLNQAKTVSITIPIPPLCEQQRIVEVLDREFDRIDTIRKNAETTLQFAKDLMQAKLKEELQPKEGWERKKLGDVCKYHKEQGLYTDLPYIGMENIESGTGGILSTVDSSTMKSTSFKFNKGEVLYGRLRPYLRKAFVAEFEGCCSTEVFPILPTHINSYFLLYWLLSDKTTEMMERTCAGCRMPRANMKEALTFEIPMPPLDEQQQIVSRLDRYSETCKKIEENSREIIAQCDALKQSFLRKAFDGEL